jgi:hypothetical protein
MSPAPKYHSPAGGVLKAHTESRMYLLQSTSIKAVSLVLVCELGGTCSAK